MTKVNTYTPFLMVLLVLGCGAAAAPFSSAQHYAKLVEEGKQEATHSYHQEAEEVWRSVSARIPSLDTAERAQWYLARADYLQFGHQFTEALETLERVEATGMLVGSALLMRARILLTLGEVEPAAAACQQLRGLAPVDVWATCELEVKGRAGELKVAYEGLSQLAERNTASTSAIALWRRQILAEQAHLLGNYDAALNWLQSDNYATQPVVAQKQIIDVWLLQNRPQQVLSQTSECPVNDSLLPDSLIVRFARAELEADSAMTCWRELAGERIHIRELRHDELHTADLAYYHAYISKDADAALYWARLTVAVSREPFDLALLDAAKEL
ncbi:tetratricopeptide repeat protein [Pseudidiomarina sp.]|uniref:tetratricopeptide repeat protein n=1 Tax=Pseudidiomarina sp. TaxID=2081707 RepID=UPI003A97FE1A